MFGIKKDIVIFDLDGTLANIQDRIKHCSIKDGKLDWEKFYNPDFIEYDKPNPDIIELNRSLHKSGYEIHILSGRSDRTREATEKWLYDNEVDYHHLMMRDEENIYLKDSELKRGWLNKFYKKEYILFVVDDRKQVGDMWREEGLTCLQVAEGNF